MKSKSLPTISVAMATFNSQRTIKRALRSIRDQNYPQNHIEIIIADGGSKDRTKDIVRSFNTSWISVHPMKQNAEYNKSLALQQAKNDIVAFIDHDNVLPHREWLRNMVMPFQEHHNIVGVETLRYHYDPSSSLLDRYFALFGAADPLVWYLGKADRLSYIFDQYNLAGQATDDGRYFIVCFDKENIPTIGANGFLVRRDMIMKYAQATPGKYFDMDVNVDLINKGFNTYAFVKDSILHLTGYGNIWNFLKRRMLYMEQYRFGSQAEQGKKNRRYGTLGKSDMFRLIVTICICSTFIVPLYDSIRGWRKINDNAWFLHPFFCFAFVCMYSWAVIKNKILMYAK